MISRGSFDESAGGPGDPHPGRFGESAPIVLASGSPRRSDILRTLGIDHDIHPARIDESPHPSEAPAHCAERLARAKAAAVAGLVPSRWILAGDTVVTVDEEILGQPRDEAHAVEMLMRLQNRVHRVLSALALVRPDPQRVFSGVQVTVVRFRPFGRSEAEAYVATGEPADKAGAYGIQGRGAALVEGIEGDYTGVVGLPVPLLLRLLEESGRPYGFPRAHGR